MNDFLSGDNLHLIQDDFESKVARLSALYDISRDINSIFDRDELLRSILQKAKRLLNVEGASIIFWDQKERMFYFPVVVEETEERERRLRQLRFPDNSGVAGWVFREDKPLLVQDVSKDDRFYKEIDKCTDCETKSILCVPLHGRKGIFGVIEAVNKKSGEFTDDDELLLTAMADNIATSIEKANLYYDLQKAYYDLQKAEALLRRQNAQLKRSVRQKYSFENIIGISEEIMDVINKAAQVSLTDATVLVVGETGTGKELITQSIHNSSSRALNNFVAINCGAIPENLLESELFGHEKGAFTDATQRRIGRFEEADGGTLFLDEIGDMPLSLQIKLLRVLQDGVFQRIGSNQDIPVDVRVIAATNQDLDILAKKGIFRQDLYFRLNVFELKIPPLRERREDIPLLIQQFIRLYSKEYGKKILGIEIAALNNLCKYDYPGNVRELENIIESATILCKKNLIGICDLPHKVSNLKSPGTIPTAHEDFSTIPRNNKELKAAKAVSRKKSDERIERLFLTELLTRTRGNVTEAAGQSEMNRSWLSQLINKHKLDLKQFRTIAQKP
ncbi:MAG: sigma 54-interacting transcriptional regulator [bacterium]